MGTLFRQMTLKDRYGFGGFSGTPPSEPNLSTPPPPPPGRDSRQAGIEWIGSLYALWKYEQGIHYRDDAFEIMLKLVTEGLGFTV